MAFLFRMNFTGLCAFVPRDPQGAGTVLLVNTLDPADDLNFHGELHQHVPRVRHSGKTISLFGKEISYSVTGPATIEPNTLQLNDQTVTPPLPTKPTPEQARDVFWIANMAELEGGIADDSCFGVLPNSRVSARVRLSAGFLSASRIIEVPGGDVIAWNFKKSSSIDSVPTLVRAMAAEFSLTALVNGTEITLDILDHSTATTTTETLKPVGGEVVVLIENSCFCSDERGPLEDFAFFYRLAKTRGALHLPDRTNGGDLSDTLCPPARFAPHASA